MNRKPTSLLEYLHLKGVFIVKKNLFINPYN
ncbi:hypothetical protein HMPREF9699_01852 [Bergeyella zoohelcum ATCC 43767]|uniref:Uncharacterized protein n=1 Tax=Bergeyella zoohelcum ATCC 43767 TaxID=883096 RepID=K1LZM3_9FLAO|nr:hypothetical protein HMPREF9699_01852 [Bergeyella zoohelcum ATCC 43767]SUV50069.1 Uncharacterised protein [Bergeyella zoohelcum]